MAKYRSYSRRTFIRKAGEASLLLGQFTQRPAKSWANPILGANERLVLGQIGCGGRGTYLMRHFMNGGATFAAVCDPDDSQMKKAREVSGGNPEMIKDFRKLLEHKDIDAVVVATPDHWHALPTVLACQAGKDVYVEKPLSYSVMEGRAMVEAARHHNRIVQIGTQQRSGEHYHRAVGLLKSGGIGKVSHVRVWNCWNVAYGENQGRAVDIGNPRDCDPPPGVDYDLWLGPAPKRPFNPNRFHWNYIFFWDYAGGMMTGWTVHHIDVVHWAMGVEDPLTVSASGGKHVVTDARETPDTMEAIFDYPGFTLMASVYHANARPIEGKDYGIAFYGSKGTLVITREGYEVYPEGDQTPAVKEGQTPTDGPHQQEFIENCKSRKKPFADVETGLKSTIPTLIANIALKTGRKLHWDAVKERFVNDPEADNLLRRDYRKPWKLS